MNKYPQFENKKLHTEREQLIACMECIIEIFDRMQKKLDKYEEHNND